MDDIYKVDSSFTQQQLDWLELAARKNTVVFHQHKAVLKLWNQMELETCEEYEKAINSRPRVHEMFFFQKQATIIGQHRYRRTELRENLQGFPLDLAFVPPPVHLPVARRFLESYLAPDQGTSLLEDTPRPEWKLFDNTFPEVERRFKDWSSKIDWRAAFLKNLSMLDGKKFLPLRAIPSLQKIKYTFVADADNLGIVSLGLRLMGFL